MGEYLRDNDRKMVAKLGTCSDWRYVRRDECFALREAGYHYDGDWAFIDRTDRRGPIFRFPWPWEDGDLDRVGTVLHSIGERNMDYTQVYPVPEEVAFHFDHQGYVVHVQPRHYCGYGTNVTLPCPNSEAGQGLQFSAGGPKHLISIVGERRNAAGWYTVFGCPFCERWFALTADEMSRLELPTNVSERIRAFIPTEND